MRGVPVGVVIGFVVIWVVASQTEFSWPWNCLIGGSVNVVVSIIASLLLDGRQADYSPSTVRGQLRQFKEEGRPLKEGNWYVVPGKIDPIAHALLGFLVLTILFLLVFDLLI